MIEYLNRIFKSCYSKEFYASSQAHTFFERLVVLYLTVILTILLVALYYSKNIVFYKTSLTNGIEQLVSEAKQIFPSDLEINLENGELNINQDSPFFIEADWIESEKSPQNFIVYDQEGSFDDYSKYDALVLVTKKFIASKRDNGKIEMFQFSDFGIKDRLSLNYNLYSSFIDQIWSKINSYKFVILFAFFMLGLFFIPIVATIMIIYKLFVLLFYALIGLIVSKVSSRDFSYAECYLNSMYLLVPMSIVSWLAPNLFVFWLRLVAFIVLFYTLVNKSSHKHENI